ncbi:cation diffusion facilitator family transporter [Halomonas aquamarina]|uniref:Cation diffusion facilitator family transporter n=1 Tax=Vreelandella aquamarina TaxID=77097 RepID=A0ACC5VS90_9GAMM|nr:cation diffusion facilitator family transporter [Halomonas aquamarina]MBZ5486522.1 cation diffusion facilitator family transporter [Halomonas aquamarina]
MKIRHVFHLPAHKQKDLDYLIRLEWWNLAFRISIVSILALVLGNSQAMKVAWLEDMLSLIPPIAFLLAVRFRARAPNKTYPYGYQRVTIIAFLLTAMALSSMGCILLIDSLIKLMQREHPSIGAIELFGHTIWMGWVMIAVLIYSVIPPVIIGRLQLKAAAKAHEKTVHADGKMSKADWMTGLAAIVGVLGVGAGFWWADAVAAAIIALDVTKDGFVNLKEAVSDLMDRRPHLTADRTPEHLEEALEDELKALPWVIDAEVRLREEGHAFSGEAFVIPDSDEHLARRLAEASEYLTNYDWRIYEIVVTARPKES